MNVDEPRVRYSVDVLGELFPGATVSTSSGRPAGHRREFALAPSGRRPRLLVPLTPRGAAASAIRAYGGRLSRRARWSYGAAAAALAAAGPAMLRGRLSVTSGNLDEAPGIDDYLSDVLGRRVSVAVHLTPERANRKPIVQALAAGERHPVAFAKVGVNPLTKRLVNQEALALELLADRTLRHLSVPAVAHHGAFAGHDVLTMRPLPTWRRGHSATILDAAVATREIAAVFQPSRMSLQDSHYWLDVQRRVGELPSTQRADRLARGVERLTALMGRAEITFTASHGDWTPWNMWCTDSALLVWDWERFATETPRGFDLLHFWLNEQFVRDGQIRPDVAHRLILEAPDLLRTLGTPPGEATDDPDQTALLYLVHIGLRYEADGQADAGAAVGRLETWLLPALEAALANPAMARPT